MNFLALETATPMCSVALSVSGQVMARAELAARGHAMRLLPWVDELLAEAELGFAALDGVIVGRGPGGFTSLRIGLSVAQGIALAHDRPVYPVSSLAALALAADPAGEHPRVLALIDARMGEVFAGWFRREQAIPISLCPEKVLAPAEVSVCDDGPWLVAGSGLAAYHDLLVPSLGAAAAMLRPDVWPLAEYLFGLAEQTKPVPAWQVEPLYVRNRVTQ